MNSPLPPIYFHIFGTINPIATAAGALAALFDYANFHRDLMPVGFDILGDKYASSGSPRLALHGVGVGIMYLIHASLYIAIPRLVRRMGDRPDHQLDIMWWFILCTWWPEWVQTFGILYHLPPGLRSPGTWGHKLGGKMWYQVFIMSAKALYLLGVGRGDGSLPKGKPKSRN